MKRLSASLIVALLLIGGLVFVISAKQARRTDALLPKPWHRLSYVGSIGIGKDKVESGIVSFRKNYEKLDELSLYWYNLETENRISRDSSVSEDREQETIAFARQTEKKVLFGISDHGEAEKADDILSDDDKQKDHIAHIISIINDKGYDGVIIDYENLDNYQEEDFTNYMRKLSNEIHSKGKTLGISVPVETQGAVSHGINLVDISKVVDKMHMNVYEQHGQETKPGPIASMKWADAIIKNALEQEVEPNKIVLGTAHSGHDWVVGPDEEFYKDMDAREAQDLLAKTNASVTWDGEKMANYFEYTDDDGKKHVIWLEDARSFKAKTDLAKSYRLQGIFIWYLGGEDPGIWELF